MTANDSAEIGIDAQVPADDLPPVAVRRRRVRLPVVLFILTVLSTFWVGAMLWRPMEILLLTPANVMSAEYLDQFMPVRESMLENWRDGLIYSCCLLAILFFHEMGHFLATVRYRIPASYPFFIPLPITPIGTMGAVIGMDGMRANRKEMFDIGIAGPLAGLIVAIPVMWVGIKELSFTGAPGSMRYHLPLAVEWIMNAVPLEGYNGEDYVAVGHMNPYFMAGWVGLLITGVNMLPVSQLDGGHVTYTLYGRGAHWLARGFMVLVIAYVVYSLAHVWMLMIILVMLIGTDHPPTYDDSVRLGWFRYTIGSLSMLIPILCFPPKAISMP